MKTYPLVAIATLGVWMAGFASVQAGTSQDIVDLTAPTAIRDVALAGPGADRHDPLARRYVELTRYGADRHPPLATQYAELTGQDPIQVVLQFGTETKNFAMTPKALRLEKGKLYRLVIVNPSKTAHFVLAPEFGAAIDSIHLTQGVALRQGDQQVWYFAADQAGTYGIMCGYNAHAKAGMVGKINVSSRRD